MTRSNDGAPRVVPGRQDGAGLLDAVPRELPALAQCQRISVLAAGAGFEWESVADVWSQVRSERQEFEAEEPGTTAAEEEFGDILFALVNVARWQGVDAERALMRSNDKFRRRWAAMERRAQELGVSPSELSTARLNELWDEAKAQERA